MPSAVPLKVISFLSFVARKERGTYEVGTLYGKVNSRAIGRRERILADTVYIVHTSVRRTACTLYQYIAFAASASWLSVDLSWLLQWMGCFSGWAAATSPATEASHWP